MTQSSRSLKAGDTEFEFGVAIPGTILPVDQWAKTAIHRLPEGILDTQTLFGRVAPTVLDIGCGNGRFVISSAVLRPEVDHIGIDILPVVIRYATRRGKERGLSNTRFAVCGGFDFLERHAADNSFAEIHVYHPQPYANSELASRRLLSPQFLVQVHRALQPNGKLFLQSDNPSYWKYIRESIGQVMDWQEQSEPWPDYPLGISRRELIATSKKLPIFRAIATRRDLDPDSFGAIANQLPQPTFSAPPQSNRPSPQRRPVDRRPKSKRPPTPRRK
jgi:tRNA (guanine-N7-)-methyltransferase